MRSVARLSERMRAELGIDASGGDIPVRPPVGAGSHVACILSVVCMCGVCVGTRIVGGHYPRGSGHDL